MVSPSYVNFSVAFYPIAEVPLPSSFMVFGFGFGFGCVRVCMYVCVCPLEVELGGERGREIHTYIQYLQSTVVSTL